ncbi:hypothetical protein G9A89_010009 [Geosiphon pyriformis]|nr:hypothetical protein G9A89_010009 [Geosiphon pyriformis]
MSSRNSTPTKLVAVPSTISSRNSNSTSFIAEPSAKSLNNSTLTTSIAEPSETSDPLLSSDPSPTVTYIPPSGTPTVLLDTPTDVDNTKLEIIMYTVLGVLVVGLILFGCGACRRRISMKASAKTEKSSSESGNLNNNSNELEPGLITNV